MFASPATGNQAHPRHPTSLRLKIPTSPESDGEIYSTPNTSVAPNDDESPACSSHNGRLVRPQHALPSARQRFETMLAQRAQTGPDSSHAPATPNGTTDTVDGRSPDSSYGAIYRMKSLGNITQYERAFGDTPKELLQLKDEFERRRLQLVRRRSLTSLLCDDDAPLADAPVGQPQLPAGAPLTPEKEPMFAARTTRPYLHSSSAQKYRKKIGIGDTKYIGLDDSCDSAKMYNLTKMKSMGTLPDQVSGDRVHYDPFLTPNTERRRPAHKLSLHNEFGAAAAAAATTTTSSSGGSSDEEQLQLRQSSLASSLGAHSTEHLRFMNEVTLLHAPFERGFRRSYVKDTPAAGNGGGTVNVGMRQSDGYFRAPHAVAGQRAAEKKQRSSNDLSDSRTRLSLHNLSQMATGLGIGGGSTAPKDDGYRNHSTGSMSETGSLDRMKAAAERRKKCIDETGPTVSGRVEGTRVNPDSLIDELLKNTKLDQLEESAETSGLKLYIARDGTASLGSHEVKSRMPGAGFQQVVMENPR